MLKTIAVENFQAHKETYLEFVEGVNVITGSSDSGKTSLMRASKWVITNRPSGDAFKNWDAGKDDSVSVEITLDDSKTVSLSRINGKNTYLLSDNGKETTFSAIKTDVPEEITAALNIPERSIQTQHQEYFLLQDSPGTVAQKLNDLIGLTVIDTMFKNLTSKIRETTSRINFLKSERDKFETSLEKFENLEAVGKLLDSIEQKEATASVIASSLNDLRKNVSTLKEINSKRETLSPLLELESPVNLLLDKINSVLAARKKIKELKTLIASAKQIQEFREEDRQWIDLEPYYTVISTKIETLEKIKDQRRKIQSFLNINSNIQNSKSVEKIKKVHAIKEYVSLLEKNKICPTCMSPITDSKIKSITKEL